MSLSFSLGSIDLEKDLNPEEPAELELLVSLGVYSQENLYKSVSVSQSAHLNQHLDEMIVFESQPMC